MTFVIDTSASMIAWAGLFGDNGGVRGFATYRDHRAITSELASMVKGKQLTAVAVAIGPGSFTGLRVGVSFGLGLAMGLRIPIMPLSSLDLQAARADVPATAVIEAGRGRVYYKAPAGNAMLGGPDDVPASYPLVGNVAPLTQAALEAAGRHFLLPDLSSWGKAASRVLETAREVPYSSLKLEYMQSFSASK